MNHTHAHYAGWLLLQTAKKLGFWGLLGLVLIMASLFFYVVKVPKIDQAIQALKIQNLHTNHQNFTVDGLPESENLNQAQEISHFYQRFPTAASLPEILLQMNKVASEQQLALNSGDYKLNWVKKSNGSKSVKSTDSPAFTKYEITLPIKGRYTQIRTFLTKVLEQNPALALIDMQLKRDNSINAEIEAHLVFVLFTKDEA